MTKRKVCVITGTRGENGLLYCLMQECFKYLDYKKGDFPVAEKISREIMSLPMNPYLSDQEITHISEAL